MTQLPKFQQLELTKKYNFGKSTVSDRHLQEYDLNAE